MLLCLVRLWRCFVSLLQSAPESQLPVRYCADESETQHWRGMGFGHGPIEDPEPILFVLFGDTAYDPEAMRLKAGSFKRKRLTSGDESVARKKHTTIEALESNVVAPQKVKRSGLVGVACAKAEKLRALEQHVNATSGPMTLRTICVLDKVEEGDHDGHGTLKFADAVDGVSPEPTKGMLRGSIMTDLAEAFGPILSLDDAYQRQS